MREKLNQLDNDLINNISATKVNSDFLTKLREDHDSLYHKHDNLVKVTIGKSTKGGINKIKQAFKMRIVGRRNLFFKKWVGYTIFIREKIIEKAIKFNKMMTLVYDKVDRIYSMKLILAIWRKNKNRMKKYEKHKRLIHYIVRKWLKRVHKEYDLVHYLRIWKRNIVLHRPGIKELPPSLLRNLFEEIKTDGFGLALVIQKLMAEMQGQNQLFSNQSDQLKLRVNEVDGNLESLENKIINIINDKFAILDKEVVRVEKIIKEKISEVSEMITNEANRAANNQKLMNDRMSKIEDFINNLGNTITTQNNKIEKTMILQGKQITRCDAIEKSQIKFENEKVKLEEKIEDLSKKYNTEFKDLVSEVGIFKSDVSVQNDINERQFQEIYQKTYDAYEYVNKIAERNTKQVGEMFQITTASKEKVDLILERLKKIDTPPPTPDDLLKVYLLFESDMASQRSGGVLVEEFSNEVADKFVSLVKRVASMINEKVSAVILSNAVSKSGLDSGFETPIKSVSMVRDEEVDMFISLFVKLLQDRDTSQSSGANIVKAKARIVFYRRFMFALGLAFSSLGQINIEYPTALTIKKVTSTNNSISSNNNSSSTNIANSTCLVCNRPEGYSGQNSVKKIISDLSSITEFNQIKEKYPYIIPATSNSSTNLTQDLSLEKEDHTIKNIISKTNRPQTAIHRQAFPLVSDGDSNNVNTNNNQVDHKMKKPMKTRPASASTQGEKISISIPSLAVKPKKLSFNTKVTSDDDYESNVYEKRMEILTSKIDKDEVKRQTIAALRNSLKIPLKPQYNKNQFDTTDSNNNAILYSRSNCDILNSTSSLSVDPELATRMTLHNPSPPII